MGQRNSGSASWNRRDFERKTAELTFSNDRSAIEKFESKDRELRQQEAEDERLNIVRAQDRARKHEAARNQAASHAARLGVSLPPIPIYRSQHELRNEILARDDRIAEQANQISDLQQVVAQQEQIVREAQMAQQQIAEEIQRRQSDGESYWKGKFAELLRWRQQYEPMLRQTADHLREAVLRAASAAKEYNRFKDDVKDFSCDACFDRLKAVRRGRRYRDDIDSANQHR